MKHAVRYIFLISLAAISAFSTIKAQIVDTSMSSVYAMSLEELMNTKVSIATKSDQPLSETPSIVSVITSEDIKNMGARELVDVLQTLPGFELTRRFTGEIGIGVRGVKDSRNTSKLLIMINGVPYNQLFYGNSIIDGYDINLDAVERIEIIRGPGSALYGRNAFSGVINIITKNGKTDNKVTAKGEVGTFNTESGSVYYGLKKEKINASLALQRLYTNGTDVKFDDDFGHLTKSNIYNNNFSINTNVGIDKFTISVNYFNLKDGINQNRSEVDYKKGYYSLSYNKDLNSKISINAKLFGYNANYIEDIEQFKPGDSSAFPKGQYFKPQLKEYLYGFESEMNYKLFFNNDLLFGIQADKHGVKDVILTTNYDFSDGLFDETRNNQSIFPGWFFVGDTGHNYADYYNIAFFMQDIWHPMRQLGITVGGRYDIDSQIGGIFNPRAGIVWSPVSKGSIKLLYGRAYRAPAPSEQYQTFGYATGNPDLKPEIINTYELAFSHRFEKVSNSVSFFLDKLTNIIYAPLAITSVQANKYFNMGSNTSYGLEYENNIMLKKSFSSYFNCSYTISKNRDSLNKSSSSIYNAKDVAPLAINFGMNYSFLKFFNLNLNMYYRSKMGKFTVYNDNNVNLGEVQDPIGNYAVFNTTIGANDIIKHLKFSLSVYNMFDAVYYAQENDMLKEPHQPGRQFIFHLSYLFKD